MTKYTITTSITTIKMTSNSQRGSANSHVGIGPDSDDNDVPIPMDQDAMASNSQRDSSNSHSRLNLADLDSEIATAEANLNKYNLENPNGSDSLCNGAEDTEAQKLQGILNDYRRKKCLRDCYKNWGFLACVACVLIGTIVLIVLLATGIISLDAS